MSEIRFAFSTVACPQGSLDQVLDQAKQMGYAGVELRTLSPDETMLPSDPAHLPLASVQASLDQSGIEPICLSTSQAMHHRKEEVAAQAAKGLRKTIQLAHDLGCPLVRIFGNQVQPGESRTLTLNRIARHVMPLADQAQKLGVRLVFENAGSFATSKDWWTLLNLLEHPAVGICWNVANAAAAGESPAVSVPTLNHRIALAKVKDTQVGVGSGYLPLGQGTVQVESFIYRLMGIGYDGYVSVEWDKLWLPSLAPAEEYLPEALKTLQNWVAQASDAIAAAQVKIDKAAAKNAPKPRQRATKNVAS